MTLDKAIELLKIASEGWPVGDNEDYYNALDLSIEALKRVQHLRQFWGKDLNTILPGETKE